MLTTAMIAFGLASRLWQAEDLRWRPKSGTSHVYEFFLVDKEVSVEASLEHKVSRVRSDGSYSVTSRSLGAVVRLGGSDIRDDRPNEATASYDAYGRLTEITGGSAGLEKYRHALLTKFVAPQTPVEVGSKWVYERAKDSPKGLAACKVSYTVMKLNKDEAEVAFSFIELGGATPQSATGTWVVSVREGQRGLPLRMQAKVTNFVGNPSGETEIRLALRSTS